LPNNGYVWQTTKHWKHRYEQVLVSIIGSLLSVNIFVSPVKLQTVDF